MMRWSVLIVLALCGCTSVPKPAGVTNPARTGAVGVHEINETAAPSGRVTLAENESFQMPLADSDLALPRYPEALLSQQLPPQVVCLRVGIGANGKVMGTWPLSTDEGCASTAETDPKFHVAAVATTASWRFDPAFRCVFPDAKTKREADGLGCLGGREEPQAVTLAYRFVFEQHNGRGTVRLGN